MYLRVPEFPPVRERSYDPLSANWAGLPISGDKIARYCTCCQYKYINERLSVRTEPELTETARVIHVAWRIRSAAFSAIMMVVALVLPPIRVGMMEASTTRNPRMPRTHRY